jgi:kynurenine 3-monooxygenase
MVKKIVIVGAGPSSLLLAHYLLRRPEQYQIEIYEYRSDPRQSELSKRRTFPLSLGERGMSSLRQIAGLEEAIQAISVEMTGSMFHAKNGKSRTRQRKKPLITLDRNELVIVLLEKLVEFSENHRLKVYFNHRCTRVNLEEKTVIFASKSEQDKTVQSSEVTVNYDVLVGADGARSMVRTSLLNTPMFEYQQKYVANDYKSIFISTAHSDEALDPQKIHAWQLQDGTTLLLLHQKDGSLNGVVHFPRHNNQIIGLSSREQVLDFFAENFPKVGQLISQEEAAEFLNRPPSSVLTVRCNRYHDRDSILLIGDAAHAVSPSIGQGCNAALEDVAILNHLLDEYDENWAKVLEEFTHRRIADGHALVELGDYTLPFSIRLYVEFILRDIFHKTLHRYFPKYVPASIFEQISETTIPFSQILASHRNWVEKVKRSVAASH